MEKYPVCLAAYSIDEDRIKSSSGGIFAEIAKSVLNRSGVVFGASIDSDGRVFHKYITKKEDLDDLLGSKYVQSNIGASYKDVKQFLKDNKEVLFCGTPCQNEGLLSFLGSRPDNLILIDFVCHGVPSFKVFHNYLKEISDGKEVDKIYFRDKEHGWLDYSFKVNYKNGDSFSSIFKDNNYMRGFVYNYYLRPSCYKCRFKGVSRNTDITMGDFWGIQEEEPDFYDENGVSILLLHNEIAENIIAEIGDRIVSKKIDAERVIKHNPSIVSPSDKDIMHDLFFIDMKRGVDKAIAGIIAPNKLQKIRNKLYRGAYKTIKKARLSVFSRNTRKNNNSKIPIIFERKEDCCGCHACENVCPKGAISMHNDKEGFDYPSIDKGMCIGCNSCVSVCPISNFQQS